MHWAKQLMKTSKHLGSESKIASDYYHDLGVKNISRVVGTSKFIDEKKEKKYIEKLRKHYKAVGSSNIVFKTDVKKQKKTFFTEDDFNEDGSIKMSSILSPKKNMGVNMILPGLAAYAIGKGGQHVAKKLSNAKVKKNARFYDVSYHKKKPAAISRFFFKLSDAFNDGSALIL